MSVTPSSSPQRTTLLEPDGPIVRANQQIPIAVPKRSRPLSGLDAGFLYLEAAGTPMHVGSVMLLRAPNRQSYDFYKAVVTLMRERMPEAAPLRRVLQDAPLDLGHPHWIESPAVNLDRHIEKRKLAAPGSLDQSCGVSSASSMQSRCRAIGRCGNSS